MHRTWVGWQSFRLVFQRKMGFADDTDSYCSRTIRVETAARHLPKKSANPALAGVSFSERDWKIMYGSERKQRPKQRKKRAVPYATADLPPSHSAFTASERANADPAHRTFSEIPAMRIPSVAALAIGANSPLIGDHRGGNVSHVKTLIKRVAEAIATTDFSLRVNFAPGRPIFAAPNVRNPYLPLKIAKLSLAATWHFACSPQAVMNDKKTWWQVLPMGKQGSIFAGVIAFALVVFLARAFWTPNDRDSLALQQQEEKIKDMEDRLSRLEKELEQSSKQIAPLQAGSDATMRLGRPAQRKVNNSRRETPRLADQNPSPEPRFYQTVRSTSVFEEPSASSRKVGSISNGSRVRVIGSTGDWLEVRSKQGRPPGFIRQDDAVLMR